MRCWIEDLVLIRLHKGQKYLAKSVSYLLSTLDQYPAYSPRVHIGVMATSRSAAQPNKNKFVYPRFKKIYMLGNKRKGGGYS
jgi:hypothetical protein